METKKSFFLIHLWIMLWGVWAVCPPTLAQLNTEKVMANAKNALYFEDYVLSIQYFNRIIRIKPYLAEPYFFRGVAKLYLEDYKGAEEDCSLALERNPYLVDAYACRGIAHQNMNQFLKAVEDYEKGMKYAPESKLFLVNRATCLAAEKRYNEAEEAYTDLLRIYPSYSTGYVGRAYMYLEKGDTLLAERDLDKSISLNKYEAQAFSMRSYLKTLRGDYSSALEDIEQALKQEPTRAGHLLNRAIIRYNLNNLKGALSDYNRILSMYPSNLQALYNRGLLRSYIGDKNRALEDFSEVLKYDPENDFARYNRATLNGELGFYHEALKDIAKVLKKYPDFLPAYLLSSEMKKKINDTQGAERDYWTAYNLQEKHKNQSNKATSSSSQNTKTRTQNDKNINKFDRLLMAEPEKTSTKTSYKSDTRGHVQNKHVIAGLQPLFSLTYYEKYDRIEEQVLYLASLSQCNKKRILPRELKMTNTSVALSETQVERHFKSIEQLTGKIHQKGGNNELLYFARSIDFMLVQDYVSAINDLDSALQWNPKNELAYFNRSVLMFRRLELEYNQDREKGINSPNLSFNLSFQGKSQANVPSKANAIVPSTEYKIALLKVKEDLEKVLSLNPQNFFAYYNIGNIEFLASNPQVAIKNYSKATEIEPNFADAYYNRGLVYTYLGKTEEGISDLSKAGELGIVEAYNLIKRLSD